jgi:large subunit ribosomal protein L18
MDEKVRLREKRHRRVRAKVSGTADRPRMNVFRSLKNTYVQLVDDASGHTVAAASTVEADYRKGKKAGGNIDAAKAVGALIAKRAKDAGVSKCVFDRGGWQYHGRIKQIAEAAREGGLEF